MLSFKHQQNFIDTSYLPLAIPIYNSTANPGPLYSPMLKHAADENCVANCQNVANPWNNYTCTFIYREFPDFVNMYSAADVWYLKKKLNLCYFRYLWCRNAFVYLFVIFNVRAK